MKHSTTTAIVILLFIFSFSLNLYNNGFDYHFHRDEPKKVKFINIGTQDFMHPTLMLKVSKIIKKITKEENQQQIAVAGRNVSAFMGACIVVAGFLIAQGLLSVPFALLACLSISVSPILVIHVHYLKEDVYFTAPLLFSIFFLIKLLETNKRAYCLAFGLCYGLALSSQYKAAIFLIILLLVPFADKTIRKSLYAKEMAGSLVIAFVTFSVINYNMYLKTATAYQGLSHEINHIRTGHSIHFRPWDDLFLFHFKNSLIPGLTVAATVIATLGFLISLYRWKKSSLLEKALLLSVTVFYLAHEISPLKPAPDFMRYMIPIAPMLLIFGWLGVERMYRRLRASSGKPAGYALLAVAVVSLLLFPAFDSANIVANLVDDTRIAASSYIAGLDGRYVYEAYALPRYNGKEFTESVADINIDEAALAGICNVVMSSMEYDRYYYGLKCTDQNESVYKRHQAYERLFRYPYVEIKPKYKTFAFSNPTIRIADICADEHP